MTSIVALEHKGHVYMGGDSASVSGLDVEIMARPKVFRVGDFLIGYTSSFRMGQLLEHNLDIPENNEADDYKYLVTKFIPAVRQCLKDGGYAAVDNNKEHGGTFLVGYRGLAYLVGDDFQVSRRMCGYAACGCGESYALAALATIKILQPDMPPKDAVRFALSISGDFSAGVRPPYTVLEL